jgi:hypothetical protein
MGRNDQQVVLPTGIYRTDMAQVKSWQEGVGTLWLESTFPQSLGWTKMYQQVMITGINHLKREEMAGFLFSWST